MAERATSTASLVRHAWFGLGAIALFLVGLGGWAGTTEIAGAVVASGRVVLQEGSKTVQHPEGGIVDEILARDGDEVEAGELLVRLDGTAIAANLAVIVSQLSEAFALQARLTAESTSAAEIVRPAALDGWPAQEPLDALFAAQEKLRQSRAAAQEGLAARLEEQIAQIEEQISGLEAQRRAVIEELGILEAEGKDVDQLFAEGLVQVARVNEVKRDLARLRGEDGRIAADIAGARTAIAERRTQIAQGRNEFQAQVLEDLRAAGLQIAELLQQKIAAEDRLARLEIRAPQAGIIHESVVRTVGGVVAPGETLMQVVPQRSLLAIDTQVAPIDIDKLSVGQAASVRLAAFDVRATPELKGEITRISPDLSRDETTGSQFYSVRIALADGELDKLPEGQRLVPGMPAEAFMRTQDRTVLTYLIEPLAAPLARAFRED